MLASSEAADFDSDDFERNRLECHIGADIIESYRLLEGHFAVRLYCYMLRKKEYIPRSRYDIVMRQGEHGGTLQPGISDCKSNHQTEPPCSRASLRHRASVPV